MNTRAQKALDNLYGIPATLVIAAWISFKLPRVADGVGWSLYAVAWGILLSILVGCLVRRTRPGTGGAAVGVLLAVFGLIFSLGHG
ncbi:hypothetical protein [Streptomyces sp. ODS28]|uniref:hypothetical protein n=1 Tax=Streptomyces sp. ODS28 TaxID=3136688 RepID=UPI0031E8F818